MLITWDRPKWLAKVVETAMGRVSVSFRYSNSTFLPRIFVLYAARAKHYESIRNSLTFGSCGKSDAGLILK